MFVRCPAKGCRTNGFVFYNFEFEWIDRDEAKDALGDIMQQG